MEMTTGSVTVIQARVLKTFFILNYSPEHKIHSAHECLNVGIQHLYAGCITGVYDLNLKYGPVLVILLFMSNLNIVLT